MTFGLFQKPFSAFTGPKKTTVLLFMLAVVFCMIWMQRQNFFLFPLLNLIDAPSGDLVYEEMFFENEMGAWVYPPTRGLDENRVLIYFNGNAGNVSTRIANIRAVKQFLPEHKIFNLEYPGFGISAHMKINFENIVAECVVVVEAIVRNHLNLHELVFWGESIGSLIQARVFTQCSRRVSKVIQINGVASLADTIAYHLPSLTQGCVLPMLPGPEETLPLYLESLDPTRHRLFLFHAENDEVVPPIQTKRLYLGLKSRFPSCVVYAETRGKHNMSLLCQENRDLISRVLQTNEFHCL